MSTNAGLLALSAIVAVGSGAGCASTPTHVAMKPAAPLAVESTLAQDKQPKEELRLVPAEAYVRTYLTLFGGLSPLAAQKVAREGALFDSWDEYFAALGFPDYRLDLPRGTQTNALMIAAFERLGVALCDRAVEHDLKAAPPTPLSERRIFAFEPLPDTLDETAFAPRFDVLHRTFLGYPASLAPTDRTHRFFKLYTDIVRLHGAPGARKTRFSPNEAAWAGVCYGLVRHPEFQFY